MPMGMRVMRSIDVGFTKPKKSRKKVLTKRGQSGILTGLSARAGGGQREAIEAERKLRKKLEKSFEKPLDKANPM